MTKAIRNGLVAVGVMVVSAVASATGTAPDFSGLTDQVDWTTAIAAVLLIAGGIAGVYIVIAGAKLIIAAIKRA